MEPPLVCRAGGNGTKGPALQAGRFRVPGTKLWVGDYTPSPRTAASGVFTHEFGHDLGLPDHYDTAGANDNSADFWTLMASSWPSTATSGPATSRITWVRGTRWCWVVRPRCVDPGQVKKVNIGPAEGSSTSGWQALASICRTTCRTPVFPVRARIRTTTTRVSATTSRPRCVVRGGGVRGRHGLDVPGQLRHRTGLGLCLRRVLR